MAEQIEATLDDLKAKIDAKISAKIASINSGITDGFTLDDPALVAVGGRDVHDYPQVFVLPEETNNEADTGGRVIWLHTVRVVSFVADWDQEALARKVIRYQRAVREVCLENRRPGATFGSSGGWGIVHDRDEYGPIFQPTDQDQGPMEFVQGAASLFVVRQDQTLA